MQRELCDSLRLPRKPGSQPNWPGQIHCLWFDWQIKYIKLTRWIGIYWPFSQSYRILWCRSTSHILKGLPGNFAHNAQYVSLHQLALFGYMKFTLVNQLYLLANMFNTIDHHFVMSHWPSDFRGRDLSLSASARNRKWSLRLLSCCSKAIRNASATISASSLLLRWASSCIHRHIHVYTHAHKHNIILNF